MPSQTIDVCVIGGGPSGLLAAHVLRSRGAATLLITNELFGALQPFAVASGRVAAVPIFPVEIGFLADLMRQSDCLARAGPVEFEHRRGSLELAAMPAPTDEARLILSRKLWGDEVAPDGELPPEVRNKIQRHYPADGARLVRRGFVDGVSPYLCFLERLDPIATMRGPVEAVDTARHHLVAAGASVRYGHLVSTIPLPELCALTGIPHRCAFVAGDAHFDLFKSSEPVSANRMVYDYEPDSSVVRAYSATASFVTVQRPRVSDDPRDSVERRLQQLFDTTATLTHITSTTAKGCYPLRSTEERGSILARLRDDSILSFGRLGTWEYRDLHELDWGALDDVR